MLDQALAAVHGGRDPEPATPLLVELVDVLSRLGDPAGARKQAEQGLAAARKAGYRLGMANLLGALSRLSLRAGDPLAARGEADEQLRYREQAVFRLQEAEATVWREEEFAARD